MAKGEVLERAGFETSGYINKKGTPSGPGAHFNALPPGMNMEKQAVADIRELPYKELVKAEGFDGWE